MSAPDTAALAALPLDAVPPSLEYARGDTASLEPARAAFITMTWLAVLSGLCVASCFLVLASEVNPAAIALHLLIYGLTLWLAVRGGRLLAAYNAPSLRSRVLPVLDLIAGIGLLMIAVSPCVIDRHQGPQQFIGGFLGVAFLLLLLSTPRHVLLYRGLSGLFAQGGRRGLARWLTVLGWTKLIYEGVWLFCCCTPLLMLAVLGPDLRRDVGDAAIFLAFGALFGAMGFTVVWIMMMITHGRLAALTRPRTHFDCHGPESDLVYGHRPVVQPPVGGPLRL